MVRTLIPLASIIFIVIIIKWIGNSNREINEALIKVSEILNLDYEGSTKWWKSKEISGIIDGYKCKITIYTQSHGESSTTYISFFTYFPKNLNMGLKINWRGKFEGDENHRTDLFIERNLDLIKNEKKRLRQLKITDAYVKSRKRLFRKYKNPENIVDTMNDVIALAKKLK